MFPPPTTTTTTQMVRHSAWTLANLFEAIFRYAPYRRYLAVYGDHLGPAFSLCHCIGLPVEHAKRVIERLLPLGKSNKKLPPGIYKSADFPAPRPKAPPTNTAAGGATFLYIDPSNTPIPDLLTTGPSVTTPHPPSLLSLSPRTLTPPLDPPRPPRAATQLMGPLPELWANGYSTLSRAQQLEVDNSVRTNADGLYGMLPPEGGWPLLEGGEPDLEAGHFARHDSPLFPSLVPRSSRSSSGATTRSTRSTRGRGAPAGANPDSPQRAIKGLPTKPGAHDDSARKVTSRPARQGIEIHRASHPVLTTPHHHHHASGQHGPSTRRAAPRGYEGPSPSVRHHLAASQEGVYSRLTRRGSTVPRLTATSRGHNDAGRLTRATATARDRERARHACGQPRPVPDAPRTALDDHSTLRLLGTATAAAAADV